MKFLLWFVLIILAIRFVVRIFGKAILFAFMRSVANRVENNMKKQQKDYERHHHSNPFNQNIYQEDEVRVSSQGQRKAKKENLLEIAEEVDFEEIK